VEALAALGAQLRLQQQELDGDPRVHSLLNEVVRAVDLQLLENVDSDQQAAALALIQTIFCQVHDLLQNLRALRGGSTPTRTSFNHRDRSPASSCAGLRPWRPNDHG
jgi:hypothetical protein